MSEVKRLDATVLLEDGTMKRTTVVLASDHDAEVAKLKAQLATTNSGWPHEKELHAVVARMKEEIAELKWHWERATRFVEPGTIDTSESIVKHLATQKRVIEKLKEQRNYWINENEGLNDLEKSLTIKSSNESVEDIQKGEG